MQGCDGSVLLVGTASEPSEQDAVPNQTLRRTAFKIINDLRELVDKKCGRVVSCADIAAIAARDSVFLVNPLQPSFHHHYRVTHQNRVLILVLARHKPF